VKCSACAWMYAFLISTASLLRHWMYAFHAFDLISTASLLKHLYSVPLGMLIILMNIVAQVEQFRLLVISFMISMSFLAVLMINYLL
jgi:hypothetical protein